MTPQNSFPLIKKIIEHYKTPIHIVYKKRLQENCRYFISTFHKNYPATDYFYSYKTNSIPAILKVIHNEGFGAEVVSTFELDLALKLGIRPDRIVFNGPDKGVEGVKKAVDLGVLLINIDSFDELILVDKIAESMKRKVGIGLRIKSLYEKKSHFGFSLSLKELLAMLDNIKNSKYLELKALHIHQGTNIRKCSPYLNIVKAIARLSYMIKETVGIEIEFLDLGGGFGVDNIREINFFEKSLNKYFNYQIKIKKNVRIESFASRIPHCLKKEFRKFHLKLPTLFLEPGRAIVADAQDLFLSVICMKGKTAIVNGGLFNLAMPLMGEFHKVAVLGKETVKKTRYYKICGNLCTSYDVLFHNIKLPPLERGDIIIIMGTGAYFNSLSSNFSFPRPAVVMIYDNNELELIRRREDIKDMTDRDKIE